jgi:hypothetical protein
MSESYLTYRKSNDALPVARDGSKTIYISQSNEEEDEEQIMNYARSIDIHKLINENVNFVNLKPREKDKLRNEIILHLTKRIPPIDDNKREIYNLIVNGVKKGELKTQIVTPNILQPIPSDRTGRSVFYVSAGSGSGKSYFMSRLAKQYNVQYPDQSIFLFSFVEHDKNYDDIENLHKIPLTDEIMNADLDWDEFRNSLMLFDDYDSTPNKRLKSYIEFILSHVLVQGRHLGVSIAMTSHTNTDYRRTRLILAESTHIVVFTRTGSRKSIEYLLKNYSSLSKEDISQVFKLGRYSRYICIHKSPPQYLLTENSITLI